MSNKLIQYFILGLIAYMQAYGASYAFVFYFALVKLIDYQLLFNKI